MHPVYLDSIAFLEALPTLPVSFYNAFLHTATETLLSTAGTYDIAIFSPPVAVCQRMMLLDSAGDIHNIRTVIQVFAHARLYTRARLSVGITALSHCAIKLFVR